MKEEALSSPSCSKCHAPYQGNKEALGWCLDGVARIVGFIAPAVYISTAIINLAKLKAGCSIETPEGEVTAPDCDGKVYGLKPSSLLTTYATIVGVLSAACLPIVGAVLDHTTHRKLVGLISAGLQCVCLFVPIFITEENWPTILVLSVFSAFIGWIHTLSIFAYLPELTDDPKRLASWTANFHFIQYISLIIFLGYMIGVLYATGFNGDDILSARVAMISSFVIVTPLYIWTWLGLMKPRSALQEIPNDSSLWFIGFQKVYKTGKKLFHEHKSIMLFLLNVALVESAQQSIATVSLTYMTDTLLMTSTENGIAILVLFIFSAIGALLGKLSLRWLNPINSNKLCQLVTALNTGLAALILTGPNQNWRAYLIAGGWGLGAGWKNTVERFAVTQIIPVGQDAELMGFYLFSSQVIVWLPTLIFTSMNEAGVSQRVSITILIGFFMGGIGCLSLMEEYDEIVSAAGRLEATEAVVVATDGNPEVPKEA